METLTLPEDVARELAYGLAGEEIEGYRVVDNYYVDSGRWTRNYFLVIEEIGKLGFWGSYYSIGSTEYQDERPFEYFKTVEFARRYPKIVNRVEWVATREDAEQ